MKFLLPCILFMCFKNAFPQTENIPAKMAAYASAKNADQLFVHTDKHIYTNNESIWFSAWMLRCGNDSLPLHRFLSLVLVPADLRTAVKQQKFAMSNGYSYGSLQLPDSIAPGEYKLVACTNIVGPDSLPLALFTREISVRSIRQSEFVAAATLLEDTTGKKDLLITVRNKISGQPVRDAELSLWCGNSKVIYARTDKNGMYRQNLLVFTAAAASPAVVITKIKHKGDVEYLQHKWPGAADPRELEMKFYPEGGNLVAGIVCNIGWESKSSHGEPVTTKAVLFEDQKPIDTIQTDERGLGRFALVPHAGVMYRILPIAWPTEMSLKKEYQLPAVLAKGMTLAVPKAVAGDSLRLTVFANGYSQVNMVVHNFRTVFNQQTLTVKPGGLRVLVLLNEVPKGLTAITLLDSNNRPLAERIFFAHYNHKAVCTITPDQKVYEKRQKVTVSFRLNNRQQPSAGFAAVSCAQANRFKNSKHQDIESFCYLQAELQEAPLYRTGQGFRDSGYLENVLLVRGWRRYTWQELLAANHTASAYHSPAIHGYVVPGDGKVRKPVTINVLGGQNSVSIITTDARGHFQFSVDQLLVPQEKKLHLLVGNKIERNTAVIQDPYLAINQKLASIIPFNKIDADRYLQFAQDMQLEELKKVKQLAVVTVKGNRNVNSLFSATNACGDFVCSYNKLNCYGHVGDPGNRLPEKGKVYRLNGGGTIVYSGCGLDENNKEYEGIKIGKEFYVDDYSEASGLPKYVSTIYWSPMLVFDKDGKATASFYTSDITGRFRIVVNGVAGDNFFHENAFIDVK
ncbi:hypothetical protein [Longitalea luteola]|uniref:hypothetical protein n=1 Tax=Longitalea luteola TaxID=2812563 RepID=UPI001A95FE78|nr:hypothetical protein [Longitalea luteola]